ncbi:hypothetical protein EWM62_00160 [Mucilaginibacter terrigena]|uniref:DUF4105 domain-containing protein n=1 Tax=Mucilaginibacter terrigena TaxID=2492395 RepID=A0A4Q5LRA4_9SPHI|nr:hypothetical protein [Mucilaginibacter terrigena]RYU91893.1 hypothetical protein EWM62_00160 [Mucilaginibacter terrigena]
MKNPNRSVFFKPILLALLIHSSFIAHAQLSASMPYKPLKTDTSNNIPDIKAPAATYIAPAAKSIFDDDDDNSLQKTIALNLNKSQERKQLMGYLEQLELGNNIAENEKNSKALYRFANLFARLKLYPLAMKCFFKTVDRANKKARKNGDTPEDADDEIGAYELPINAKDDSLLAIQTEKVKGSKNKYTNYKRIAGTFNDNKPAIAYALLFHVKQPISGKPKVFVFSNTGHTFITLIKYNADSTYVSCSFGFYPKKEKILFATPWDPSADSEFKDDTGHKWDEIVGKFISRKSFERILKLTKKYEDLDYHLSSNNCTDFCLQAASLAGLSISNTKAKWPLGYGNNPGVTGQSVMEGKFHNTDQQPDANLFRSLNIDPVGK